MYVFNPNNTYSEIAGTGIGVKGRGLLRVSSFAHVPEWFAVGVEAMDCILRDNNADSRIAEVLRRRSCQNLKDAANEVEEIIRSLNVSADIRAEICAMLEEKTDSKGHFSVRVSCENENMLAPGFSGICRRFLYVRGIDEICESILRLYAYAYCEEALRYRHERGLPLYPVRMGFVIQKMVEAKTSGVIFTDDPLTVDHAAISVSVVYGSGSGSGLRGVEGDRHIYSRQTRRIETVPGNKSRRLELNRKKGSGVCENPVDEGLQSLPALSSLQVEKLIEFAMKTERFFGRPQEIEFCFDCEGMLHILQSRNIPSLREYGPAAGNCCIWDNAAISGSFSGVTSPMTFSFLRDSFAAGARAFREITCIPRFAVRENEIICRSVPGIFNGRIYLSLSNMRLLLSRIPGYACCGNLIESLAGISVASRVLAGENRIKTSFAVKILACPGAALLFAAFWLRFFTLPLRVCLFRRRLDKFLTGVDSLDMGSVQPHELIELYDRLRRQILSRWKTPLLNVVYKNFFYGILGRCCSKWCNDDTGVLRERLLCGESGIVRGPAGVLMKLALKIKSSDAVRYVFQTCSPGEIAMIISSYPDFREICADVRGYLDVFGLRCANEMKVERPTLRECPEQLYRILKNYIDMNDSRLDANAIAVREKIVRSEAEQRVFREISGLRRVLLFYVLRHARRGIWNDDEIRYARLRITDFLRRLLNALGERLSEEGILENDQDIYYLTVDEVRDYICGRAASSDLKSLVGARHVEYDRYFTERIEMSDCFLTYGMAYNHNTFLSREKADDLTGLSFVFKTENIQPGEDIIRRPASSEVTVSRGRFTLSADEQRWFIPHGIRSV